MYLAHTRSDLAYALSIVSQIMYNLGEQHMNVVMRILRNLKSAPGKGILLLVLSKWAGRAGLAGLKHKTGQNGLILNF